MGDQKRLRSLYCLQKKALSFNEMCIRRCFLAGIVISKAGLFLLDSKEEKSIHQLKIRKPGHRKKRESAKGRASQHLFLCTG